MITHCCYIDLIVQRSLQMFGDQSNVDAKYYVNIIPHCQLRDVLISYRDIVYAVQLILSTLSCENDANPKENSGQSLPRESDSLRFSPKLRHKDSQECQAGEYFVHNTM